MKKLRLNVDDLRVSSFDTSAMNGETRTVVAYDSESIDYTMMSCPPYTWTQDELGSRCCHTWILDSRCVDSWISYCDCLA